ncbi:MAG TPA: hypothetical protein VES64_01485 [Allosphingosinicella sp.]|nr:hypothetical protein [Allosphingosinicella sp.]
MRRIARTRIWAALAALIAAGCSQSPRPPAPPAVTVHLSTGNADSNAPAVAAFFRRTCIEASADADAFAAALQGSGWAHEQIQVASAAMPIAAWRLDHGELVRSDLSLAPGGKFIDCELTLDADVAPSLARMRDTLRPIVSNRSLRQIGGDPRQVKWQWRPTPREERNLTIGVAAAGPRASRASATPGLRIHLGASEVPPPPIIPTGTENVQ